jgi:large subunit ribosomal protein L25
MKSISMSGSLRENVGKKDAKKVRVDGGVPCAIYGGKEQVLFSIEEKSLRRAIFTPEIYLVNLTIDGKNYNAVVKEVQYHPVSDNIIHVDFLQVLDEKAIVLSLPVVIEGSSPGVLKGGKLVKKFRKLKIKGLAKHMPEKIVINISNLEILDAVKVSDMKIENLEFLDLPNAIIISVDSTRAAVEESTVPGKK